MDKREFELVILDQDNERLINYLKKNFTIENVAEVEFIDNMNIYKSLSEYKKKLLMSRLTFIEESHDLTTIFSGVIALFLFFLGAYNKLIEEIIPNQILALTGIILITLTTLFIFARNFGKEKGNKARVKYFLMLFKDV